MSKEHDSDESDKQNHEQCEDSECGEDGETCAKEDSAISNKETLNNDKDEKKVVYGVRGTLDWSIDGKEFLLKWNVPEECSSPGDRIVLCQTGKLKLLNAYFPNNTKAKLTFSCRLVTLLYH